MSKQIGFAFVEAFVVLLIVALIGVAVFAFVEHRGEHCVESHTALVATYPNQALMTLGSAYTALALTPVFQEQSVCTHWEKDAE